MRWALQADRVRVCGHARAALTVADLLADWLDTDHGWLLTEMAADFGAPAASWRRSSWAI